MLEYVNEKKARRRCLYVYDDACGCGCQYCLPFIFVRINKYDMICIDDGYNIRVSSSNNSRRYVKVCFLFRHGMRCKQRESRL